MIETRLGKTKLEQTRLSNQVEDIDETAEAAMEEKKRVEGRQKQWYTVVDLCCQLNLHLPLNLSTEQVIARLVLVC